MVSTATRRGLILRIAEDAGRNERGMPRSRSRAPAPAGGSPGSRRRAAPLAMPAAAPDRADGVDDVPAGQPIGPVSFASPGPAAAEPAALRQQLRSRRAMDAAVHAAPAEQALVCRVDDGIHGHFVMSLRMKCRGMVSPYHGLRIICILPYSVRKRQGTTRAFPAFPNHMLCTLLARLLQ